MRDSGHMKIAFGREYFSPGRPWTELAPLLPGWELTGAPRDRLREVAADADVVCPFAATVDAPLLEEGRFGLVQQFGVGLEKVDAARAGQLGVWVARLPGDLTGNAAAVAELAVLHLLALRRRLDDVRAAFAERRWGQPMSGSLLGTTVLVVGLGAIGTAVAERLAPFGVRVLGVRARPERGGPPCVSEVGSPADLHRMLGQADAVVCCALYDGGNGGMFDAAAFAAMRPGALFVNVARGGLVDEPALLAALESGQVGGAGLDVFAREPLPPGDPLGRHPRVLATPHVGGLTDVMFERSARAFAANVLRWAAGEPPRWAVNAPPSPRRP